MPYIKRTIEPLIIKYLSGFPAVGITGPRQSGKSTLLKNLLPEYTYITFDDPKMRDFLDNDPEGFIAQYSNKVIFDEAQKAPEIFSLVKIAIDKDRMHYGNFVLTGSSQFTLLKKISESLAGRIGLLSLLPFQFTEIPENLRNISVYKGSFPELVVREYSLSNEWYDSYLETYISKDLRDISNIGNLRDFRRFIHMLAINTSQQLNMSNYAKELGVSVPTIKNWLSILEASYIIFFLPPYYKNYGKRLTKNPKIYFYDPGLVAHLTAVNTQEQFVKGPMCGAIFENYLIAEIKKKIMHSGQQIELFYYRTSHGTEIDLIIDDQNSRDLIEVKYTTTPNIKMFEAMKSIMQSNDRALLLYNGTKFSYGHNIFAINYKDYLTQSKNE